MRHTLNMSHVLDKRKAPVGVKPKATFQSCAGTLPPPLADLPDPQPWARMGVGHRRGHPRADVYKKNAVRNVLCRMLVVADVNPGASIGISSACHSTQRVSSPLCRGTMPRFLADSQPPTFYPSARPRLTHVSVAVVL